MPATTTPKFLIYAGRFFFRTRNALFPVMFGILLVVTRPDSFFMQPGWPSLWIFTGAIVIILGEAIRLVTIGLDYIDRGGRNRTVYASRLVTDGIFHHTRNPMYVGNIAIVMGLCMFSGSIAVFCIAVPFFLFVYCAIVAAEETYLSETFGAEYDTYCKNVNRFLPSFRDLNQTLGGMTFQWKRSLRKDYGNLFVIALGFLLLPVWRVYFLEGSSVALNLLPLKIREACVAGVVYVAVWALKKKGLLADSQG